MDKIFKIRQLVLGVILLAIGCTDNSSEISDKELAETMGYESMEEYINSSSKKIAESILHPYTKEATLLSVKYKVDKDKIKDLFEELNILHSYNSITNDEMAEYSKQYGIPSEIIASLIIDFYSMQKDE